VTHDGTRWRRWAWRVLVVVLTVAGTVAAGVVFGAIIAGMMR
jgi:hypothetical protein